MLGKFESLLQIGTSGQSEIDLTQFSQQENNSKNLILNQLVQSQSGLSGKIVVKNADKEQFVKQEKCLIFAQQFKEQYDKVERQEEAKEVQEAQLKALSQVQTLFASLAEEDDDSLTEDDYFPKLSSESSLPHLFISSVEFCFNTQALNLSMAYDLKIAECVLAMHQFMQIELF